MIVLDASAAIELLLGLPHAAAVARHLAGPGTSLHVPHLLSIEVAQVARRLANAGSISAQRGEQALTDLSDLDAHRYEHEPFLPRIWKLRGNLTAYDAVYVALAETLGATLVTADARVARAPGHRAKVDLLV